MSRKLFSDVSPNNSKPLFLTFLRSKFPLIVKIGILLLFLVAYKGCQFFVYQNVCVVAQKG
jgi:hypothetical protein